MRPALVLFTVVGFCSAALASEPPKSIAEIELLQLLPVRQEILANVAFVTDTSIAVGLRSKPAGESKLTLLEWKNEELRPVASTPDFGPDILNLHRAPGGILAVGVTGSAFLYSADLSSRRPIARVNGISPTGAIVLHRTEDGWQLQRVDSREEVVRRGHDELLSVSDDVVAVKEKGVFSIETIDGRRVGSFHAPAESRCPARVRILPGERLYLDDCRGARIVDYNGNTKSRLRRPEGWSANWFGFDQASADGDRLLSVNFSRKLSFLHRAGEILVAIMTFGMGVSDEVDNREEIRVVDTRTGGVCFDRLRSFPMGWASPFENVAAISPSGNFVAVATDRHLSVYRLPSTCASRN